MLLPPRSLRVVPRAVLNEQKALTLTEAIRNVAGTGSDSGGSSHDVNGVKIKGVPINMANVDSVEVGFGLTIPPVWGEAEMVAGAICGLTLAAVLSAWLPARRASRMNVVDALNHV